MSKQEFVITPFTTLCISMSIFSVCSLLLYLWVIFSVGFIFFLSLTLCCVLRCRGQCRPLSASRHTMTLVSKLVLNQIFVASSPYPIVGTSGGVVIRTSAGLCFVTCWLADNPLPFLTSSLCHGLCIKTERWLNSSPETRPPLSLTLHPSVYWYGCISLLCIFIAHTHTHTHTHTLLNIFTEYMLMWCLSDGCHLRQRPNRPVAVCSSVCLCTPSPPPHPPPPLLPDLGLED